jgi:prepilin-type N-terminal cleavage/methylation domain-containing protein
MRRARRQHRWAQAGFTLVESLVTIAIVSASVVTLVAALGTAERSGGSVIQQTDVETALRTLGDDLRNVVGYQECPGANGYRNALAPMAPSGVTVVSVVVERPSSSDLAKESTSCATDYGVQRLTLTVQQGSKTGSTVVLKSEGTTASPAPTPSPTP